MHRLHASPGSDWPNLAAVRKVITPLHDDALTSHRFSGAEPSTEQTSQGLGRPPQQYNPTCANLLSSLAVPAEAGTDRVLLSVAHWPT